MRKNGHKDWEHLHQHQDQHQQNTDTGRHHQFVNLPVGMIDCGERQSR